MRPAFSVLLLTTLIGAGQGQIGGYLPRAGTDDRLVPLVPLPHGIAVAEHDAFGARATVTLVRGVLDPQALMLRQSSSLSWGSLMPSSSVHTRYAA